jgi:acyl carrier protein
MGIRTDRRAELVAALQELGFEPHDLADGSRFREDLAIDSTELVEISVAVERRMLVTIDSTALWSLKTVGDLVELVESSPTVPS